MKVARSHADRMGMGGPESSSWSIVALVAAVGTAAVWRILAGMVDHATRLHDTRVKAARLQIKYLERARAFRDGDMLGDEELVVEEADDAEA